MTGAQRTRDAALRRMRIANRGVLLASLAGAAMVMALAHQATPTGSANQSRLSTHGWPRFVIDGVCISLVLGAGALRYASPTRIQAAAS